MTKRTYPNKQARKVAEVIEERGWCQGTWMDSDGHVCLRTALDMGLATWTLPHRKLPMTIRHMTGSYNSIASWNDKPGRTKDEVLDMLASIPE